jgi:hypothetical protein
MNEKLLTIKQSKNNNNISPSFIANYYTVYSTTFAIDMDTDKYVIIIYEQYIY